MFTHSHSQRSRGASHILFVALFGLHSINNIACVTVNILSNGKLFSSGTRNNGPTTEPTNISTTDLRTRGIQPSFFMT